MSKHHSRPWDRVRTVCLASPMQVLHGPRQEFALRVFVAPDSRLHPPRWLAVPIS